MISDLKFALRSLRYTPGFTLVAVLIVAIGIGAATAMFSTVNALVLRPLALPEPDRLVSIYETNLPRNQPFFSVSVPNFADWRARARSWESVAAIGGRAMNLTSDGEPELVQASTVTASFFPTLGMRVLHGRNFLEAEDAPGGAPVAIVSRHSGSGGSAVPPASSVARSPSTERPRRSWVYWGRTSRCPLPSRSPSPWPPTQPKSNA